MSQIFSDQLEETKTLISSTTNSSKSVGYSTLLHLQEQSTEDHSSIRILAANTQKLLSNVVADIADEDEEIAAQALRCLGFMIYHPILVDTVQVDDACLVFESLAKLITTTKIKSICNLGVWCVSIQQLNASYIAAHFHSILRAVVHALDNPTGSLSTTFEAMQAAMKLASQIGERMRESSNIWVPLIYRRLLSTEKREKDMSERCLLKIKSTLFPPPLVLSETLRGDMKQKLLTGMKELLVLGRKVQTVQAWGWFIRLLGSHAMKDRHLVNDMLKILEQTFTDHDPQVQIASLVAWEGLIDALVHPVLACKRSAAVPVGNSIQQAGMPKGNHNEPLASGFVKNLKLIMTPLIGIMSSKCDISVHSSCFNTWCYLLHKLDTTINFPRVLEVVLEPILEAVFQVGPDALNIGLWHLCIDLLDDFMFAKCREANCIQNSHLISNSSNKASMVGPPVSGKGMLKHYPIKWLPWDLRQLEFHLKVIYMLINQTPLATVTGENRSATYDAALRIFRLALRGVQLELKSSTTSYSDIIWCLNTILRFTKRMCEAATSEDSDHNDLHLISLQFTEAITEELEPCILGSPIYKVAIDLKYIDCAPTVNNGRHAKLLGVTYFTHMDMVSPVVYLVVLYVSVVAQSTLSTPKMELILQGMHKYFNLLFSSYDPLENVHAVIGLLYKHVGFSYLKIWMVIAKCLNDCIDAAKDFSLLSESDNTGYLLMSRFLSYPFVVYSSSLNELSPTRNSCSLEESPASQRGLDLEHVVEVWKSLYVSLARLCKRCTMNTFHENVSSMLIGWIDNMLECSSEIDVGRKDLGVDILSLSGEVLICVLEQNSVVSSGENKRESDAGYNTSSDIKNSLGFASRYMKLVSAKLGTNPPPPTGLASRVFSALSHFASSLHFKQDIILFFKEISCSFVEWLTSTQMEDQSINHQLQLLWDETLQCFRRSNPPIIFDSAFLTLQAPLLEKALDHQNPAISELTISFWNQTYGEETKLDYPQSLLVVLDRLSRNGRLNLCKRHTPFLIKCNSRDNSAPQSCRVTSVLNRSSKRVEVFQGDQSDKVLPCLKRKRLELTEHQKEVRRAQQGRSRDCSGHGPGIRTYTSVDFSQGNEESQDSQEMQDPEAIMELLLRRES